MKKIAGTVWWNWMLIVVGLLASASAYRLFLVPCDIAAGGFTAWASSFPISRAARYPWALFR